MYTLITLAYKWLKLPSNMVAGHTNKSQY